MIKSLKLSLFGKPTNLSLSFFFRIRMGGILKMFKDFRHRNTPQYLHTFKWFLRRHQVHRHRNQQQIPQQHLHDHRLGAHARQQLRLRDLIGPLPGQRHRRDRCRVRSGERANGVRLALEHTPSAVEHLSAVVRTGQWSL